MSGRLRSTVPPPVVSTETQVHDQQPAAPASVAPAVLEYLDPSRNTDSNTGHIFQLEWVPDFRFPILSWLYSLARIVTNSMYVSSPYASPASIMGYTIVMYTAMLYHTDASHLLASSNAAQHIMNNAILSRFFDMLLDLPVPDFAHNEFTDIQAFLPDDIPALAFLSCLASADYYHDFGRHISANVFFAAHNLLASLPANTSTSVLRSHFYRTPVNSVTIGNTQNVNITPAHLFGRINGDKATSNWLNERIDAMVNSMAIRAVNQNNIVAQVQFPTLALANTQNYNPYTFLTCAQANNIHSITSAMRNLSQWVSSTFPASRTLRAYLQPGSHNTVNYLYYNIALPTWNTSTLTHSGPEMPTNRQSPSDLAQENGFKATPEPASADSVDGRITFNVAMPRRPATLPTQPLAPTLTSAYTRETTPLNIIDYKEYDDEEDILPRTYIFAPYSLQTGDLGPVILSGKLIESGDISGIRISVPSPDTPLLYENSQFHEGAIRLSRTRPAFFMAGSNVHIQERTSRTGLNGQVAFFRGNTAKLRLPLLTEHPVRAPSAQTTDASRLAPGADFVPDAFDTDHAVNVFGSDLESDFDLHESTLFNIWSGLRFRYHTNTGPVIHVLPTLRHIYGARARSYGTVHPALRLPL
uniref:Coat protein n=1 Tax=Sodiomyces alkalinus partitivirus 1 TaxID=2045045 RepID=A0A2D2CNL7_9VIRU|nr:coat protein [Sodiomyces alkalinus partitivirus 1]